MGNRRHPQKDINAAISRALDDGWEYDKSNGGSSHRHGTLKCPCELCYPDSHNIVVYSTPRNPTQRARDIDRAVAKCAAVIAEDKALEASREEAGHEKAN